VELFRLGNVGTQSCERGKRERHTLLVRYKEILKTTEILNILNKDGTYM